MEPYWSLTAPGGTQYILNEQNGITVTEYTGTGMPPLENVSTPYAMLDGRLYQRTRFLPRTVALSITIGCSANRRMLFDMRRDLLMTLNPHLHSQPWKLYYHSDFEDRYLYVLYDAGLEFQNESVGQEDIIARFIAFDPYWYGSTPICSTLEVYLGIAPVGNIMYRNGEGAWSTMGGGANGIVSTVIEDGLGNIYAAGAFTVIGGVAANRVAKWDGTVWTALGAGFDAVCVSLAIAPNGDLYATGSFTTAGGGAASRIAYWDGAVWNAMGAGLNGNGYVLCFDKYGVLFVGGAFGTADGVVCNKIARYSGGVFTAVGVFPGVSYVTTIDTDANDNLLCNDAVSAIYKYNGTAWSLVKTMTTVQPFVRSIANGDTLIGGTFLDGATPVPGLRNYNGTTLTELYSGGGLLWISEPDEQGHYHIARNTAIGPYPPTWVKYSIWTGSQMVSGLIGTNTGGGGLIYEIVTPEDELVIGGDFTSVTVPGVTALNNIGSANAYPVIAISGPGSLLYLVNYTTEQVLYFNITLLTGETITIDMTPGVKTITSNWRGNIISSMVYGDLVNWHLQPGVNNIGAYVSGGIATATYAFVPQYLSLD